jgi:hypothetical protein
MPERERRFDGDIVFVVCPAAVLRTDLLSASAVEGAGPYLIVL